jgi:hypothetical protein
VAFWYCWCGCGSRTSIARKTNRSKGWIKGQPKRFILDHSLDYLEMIKANQDAADFMRALAPDADAAETLKALNTRSQRLVGIQSRRDAAEEDLAKMGAAFGNVILGGEEAFVRTDIPQDAPIGTWVRLRLTRSERRQLIARLEEIFGPTVKEYVEKDEKAAPGAAVLLWTFLATSGFKASDDLAQQPVQPKESRTGSTRGSWTGVCDPTCPKAPGGQP